MLFYYSLSPLLFHLVSRIASSIKKKNYHPRSFPSSSFFPLVHPLPLFSKSPLLFIILFPPLFPIHFRLPLAERLPPLNMTSHQPKPFNMTSTFNMASIVSIFFRSYTPPFVFIQAPRVLPAELANF